ncbi:hypothetical protein ACIRT4_06700 [Pseudomonas aeruginosa]
MSRKRMMMNPHCQRKYPEAANHVVYCALYPDQHDVAEPLPYKGTLHHG